MEIKGCHFPFLYPGKNIIGKTYSEKTGSVVLAPGMPALGAPEKPHLAFISCTELAEPPDGKIVLAFGALDLDGGHGFYFILFIIHNSDLILRAFFPGLHLVTRFNLPDIAAFPAFQLASG
jgi:hypothetical protein